MDFKNKVTLITGSCGGIGHATALAFARAGANLVLVDIDSASGDNATAKVKSAGADAIFVKADVTKSADVRAYVQTALDTFGRIDCFFNNAGIEGKIAEIRNFDEDVFDSVIAVNIKGVFLGLRYVLPVMVEQGVGAVVNTSSVAGLIGTPGLSAYVASKHAVLGLTKVASTEVAGYGVRVNAICPGPVETRMMRSLEAQRSPNDPAAAADAWRAGMPTGRYTLPEEVANTVLYLCSELSGNVTGTHLVIDGGKSGSGGTVVSPKQNK